MTTITTTIRLDESDKQEANKILNELGLNFNQAMNMFVKQLIQLKGLPFDVKLPNQKTIDAMNEDYSKIKSFDNVDEMVEEILG